MFAFDMMQFWGYRRSTWQLTLTTRATTNLWSKPDPYPPLVMSLITHLGTTNCMPPLRVMNSPLDKPGPKSPQGTWATTNHGPTMLKTMPLHLIPLLLELFPTGCP
ncbi:hypothetical protein MAR_016360 [Mya arenaria]|uniref:Uncharacterized protein n=1 Tax=Mya arenaria TaxID=6604 RepID=A0ABY7FNS6_MYAAR|nr:hypothetical protein MAR_016360 [Mya arenaria]